MKKLSKYKLETIFKSTYPVDCHVVKGRLETEGINCFVYDENIVTAHPFRSVAVGGVKLKVPFDQKEKAKTILQKIENNFLVDENGEYRVEEIFDNEIERQNLILNLRKAIQKNPQLLDNREQIDKILGLKLFSENEIIEIISNENEFNNFRNLKFEFSWKQFWYELFDFERDFFKYFRVKPNTYYLEKDILDSFADNENEKLKESHVKCPKCNSTNVKFGQAIDNKYDILYLVLSLLIMTPFPPLRKKYHCFDCKHSFK